MRILFLTNFYPPFEQGGQGQSCQQVVEGLTQRGHQTLVLTSMHGTNNVPVEQDGVYRWLYLEMDFVPWRHSLNFFMNRKQREEHNLRYFEEVSEQFKPDIVFIWGMWNLPRSLPACAETRFPGRVVYRFADYWPTLPSQHELYWDTSGRNWFTQLPKQLLGRLALALLAKDGQQPPLKFENAICVSAANRDTLVEAGIPIANARIIHTGLDADPYLNDTQDFRPANKERHFKLLYAGRLSPEKGVETTIRAMAKLVYVHGLKHIKLSLAGSGSEDYETRLKTVVAKENLTDSVFFLGQVPRDEMPNLLRKFDVLLVPSIWQEPFARILLEGMISNLVVVATPTGGTKEIVVDGENGVLFSPDDAEDLTEKIVTLATEPQLCHKLAQAGQQTAIEKFTVTRMMDAFENYLQEIAAPSVTQNTFQDTLQFAGVQ